MLAKGGKSTRGTHKCITSGRSKEHKLSRFVPAGRVLGWQQQAKKKCASTFMFAKKDDGATQQHSSGSKTTPPVW